MMVGRGVMEAVSVAGGREVCVAVAFGSGEGVDVGLSILETGVGWVRGEVPPQAVRNRIPPSSTRKGFFMFFPPETQTPSAAFHQSLKSASQPLITKS
jgi:hypothetical protein